MNTLRTTLLSILVLPIALGSAFAARPVPAPKPAKPAMTEMLPAAPGSAVFVNVKRIFKLYGELITKQPQYEQVAKYVKEGMPDPAKDLDEVGISVDLFKAGTTHSGGGVVTGRVDKMKLLALAAAHQVSFTPSMFRGVALLTAKDGQDSIQLGMVDDGTTTVSMDREGKHESTKSILATMQGEAQSFGAATGTKLAKDYLALASVQITQEMIDGFGASIPEQFAIVKTIRVVSLSINAKDSGDGSARLTIGCDTAESTKGLVELLNQLRESFAGSGARGTDMLAKLKVTSKGKTATLELAVTKAELEGIVAK